MRSRLYPFTVAFTWFCSFGFNKTFPYLKTSIGLSGTFWGYAGISLIGSIFVILGIPETKNKSSEEVAAFFNKSKISQSSSTQSLGVETVIQQKDLNIV